ncbi:MAG: methyltransferase domain-containing protein [Desulfobacterota bacterium]|nr:methyltransferase domain-containing protein [Thermodesulfobacteriota bacterium]
MAECGGCQWQHIIYPHQLFWKSHIVRECFERIAGLQHLPVMEPIACEKPFKYRHRITLHIKNGTGGYYKKRSHEIIQVRECPVVAPRLFEAMDICCLLVQKNLLLEPFSIGRLHLLFVNATEDVLIYFEHANGVERKKFVLKKGAFEPEPCVEEPCDVINGLFFKKNPENFYQINDVQNRKLIRCVLAYAAPQRGDAILDLYCGSGNFSLFLARTGAFVIGVDLNKVAVKQAQENASINNIQTCRFFQLDADNLGDTFFDRHYTTVVLNPPRIGCSKKLMGRIVMARPNAVIYVSCNPATLARDVIMLLEGGYRIELIQPIDLFPQTWHIETIVLLKRT